MTDEIQTRLDQAALARAEDRYADARNGYAQAAALSRETGQPLMRALALRHLSDIDRLGGKPAEALGHAEQAAALYRRHAPGAGPDIAQALRLMALALQDLKRREAAAKAWSEARELFAAAGDDKAVAECDARLTGDEDLD